MLTINYQKEKRKKKNKIPRNTLNIGGERPVH